MARIFVALLLIAVAAPGALAQTERKEALPDELKGLEIDPVMGTQLNLELPFVDENGKRKKLGDYFHDGKPVILTLGYYKCPMLCDLVLNEMTDSLREISLDPGDDFEIVTVSFDPLETPFLAKEKKQNYVRDYERPSAARGWHFMTGKEKDIAELAAAVGFGFRWNPSRDEFMHGAAIFVFTPDGRLSRCLKPPRNNPRWFPLRSLKLALVEASDGEIGTAVDDFVLWCFAFDPERGAYTMQATRIMQIGGTLTALILALILFPVWLRSRKKSRTDTTETAG
jgi:protein SCO1/2